MCKASGLAILLPNSLLIFMHMNFTHKQYWRGCWLDIQVAIEGLPPSLALCFISRQVRKYFEKKVSDEFLT